MQVSRDDLSVAMCRQRNCTRTQPLFADRWALRKPRRRQTPPRMSDMVMIADRPAEGGSGPARTLGGRSCSVSGRSAIGTLVERTTRFTVCCTCPRAHPRRPGRHVAAMGQIPGPGA